MVPIRLTRPVVTSVTILLVITLAAIDGAATADDVLDLSRYYGFGPLEIFKLERRSHSMLPGDFNNDGKTDLVVIDNSHSRFDLLLQREAPPDGDELTVSSDPNEIGSHWRFEHKKLPIDRSAEALTVGDFNADGMTDVAYFDDGDRLTLLYQPEEGEWRDKKVIRLADVEAQPWRLSTGDLDNDGRDDLVVLGEKTTYVLSQSQPGRFDSPLRIRNTSEQLGLALTGDLDGDGREDLFYLASEGDSRKASARLQNGSGQLGPEIRFELKDTRGITLFDVVKGAGEEILSIDGTTGRVQVSQFRSESQENDGLDLRLVQYGFGESADGQGRDLATGDVDGDGLSDVVVTDPDASQVIVFRQDKTNGLDAGTAFPSFLGVDHLRIAHSGPDGRAEVFSLSTEEETLGVSRWENGRLTFPQALPVSGELLAFELVGGDKAAPKVLVLEKVRRGDYRLHRLVRRPGDGWAPESDDPLLELELDNDPGAMQSLDVNQDGAADLLLISSVGRPPTLLLADDAGNLEVIEARGGGQFGKIERGSISGGLLDKPVTIVALESFARSVLLDDDRRWQVLDQFNPLQSGAKIVGSATLDLDGEAGNELVLIDVGTNTLRVLRRESEMYESWEQVDLGSFSYIASRVVDLNADGRDDLLLFGANRFIVLYAGERPPELETVMTFESKLDDLFFADLVAGDLNSDGRPDVAVFDTRSHNVEIITPRGDELVHAINFKVFEEKSFSRRRSEGMQPREAVVADVTGDGRDDLVLLVHDRVIVYPQDDGSSGAEEAGAKQAATE